MTNTHIYVLKCPITEQVRYVGKTNNPKERYYNHLNKSRDGRTHKRNWINLLRRKGLKPKFEIVKEVPVSEWKYWEKYFIKYYKDQGCKLVNITDGGEGLSFGNQTSFKKGTVPWNKGTKQRVVKRCEYKLCSKKFSPKDKRRRFCSHSCATKAVSGFKKGHVPWSIGGGYTTVRKGCKIPEHVRNKISDTLKGRLNGGSSKPALQVSISTGKIIKEYPSAAEAGRAVGISSSRIINSINGYSNTAGGFKWIRKEDI